MTSYRWLLAATLVLAPSATLACEHLTEHFELCAEGTPWAEGRWENGGDSATLYLGEIGFEGFEGYSGSEDGGSLKASMTRILRQTGENRTRETHLRDDFTTADLVIERNIATDQYQTYTPEIVVFMIAEGAGHRIALSVRAPEGTSVDELDRLSRAYAALVRPKSGG